MLLLILLVLLLAWLALALLLWAIVFHGLLLTIVAGVVVAVRLAHRRRGTLPGPRQ